MAKVWFLTLALAVILAAGVNVSVLAIAGAASQTRSLAAGPQYGTTHVYVAPESFDRFVASLVATFGGTKSKRGDAIGRDAIIRWPGGVNTQLYWHTKPSSWTPWRRFRKIGSMFRQIAPNPSFTVTCLYSGKDYV